ncbi:MAG: IS4 family transposase [Methanobacteriaceae archaeon]|jgi:hypothetical protein|nr:IS4 family transposase [Methanobacteriaceae archaeon]
MMGVIDRISHLFDCIKDKGLVKFGRMHESDFTRNSPLNFENSLLIHLNKHGLTLHSELRNYFKKINCLSVSKQVFSKSRNKLDLEIFKVLKDIHLAEFYGTNEVKRYKSYLIFSGDGSKHNLPYKKEFIEFFGGIENKFHEITTPAINLTTIHDCLNKFAIDFEFDKYKTSERELMEINMDNFRDLEYLKDENIIFLFDRGFPSIKFFADMIENNENFIFRIKKNAYKKEKETMTSNDEIIAINITKQRMITVKDKQLKEKLLQRDKIYLRVTKVILKNGEEEHLISNLDTEKFNANDLKELYSLRWGIETSYDTLKNLMYIENLSGYTEIAVKQDYFSQILAYNITTDVENTAQKILEKNKQINPKNNPKKIKINKNLTIGIIKSDILEIAIIKDKKLQKTTLKNLIYETAKLYTQTSTQKYERPPKKMYSAKNRSNNRRSF